MNQKICANCEHVIIGPSNPECAFSDYLFRCRKCVLSTNFITGEKIYGVCQSKNENGECPDYEDPQSLFRGLLNFFKDLLGKLKRKKVQPENEL